MSHQTEWSERFDEKFNLHDERCICFFKEGILHEDKTCPHVKVKTFIATLIAEEYQRGYRDQQHHYYDKVAREAIAEERARIVKTNRDIPRILTNLDDTQRRTIKND